MLKPKLSAVNPSPLIPVHASLSLSPSLCISREKALEARVSPSNQGAAALMAQLAGNDGVYRYGKIKISDESTRQLARAKVFFIRELSTVHSRKNILSRLRVNEGYILLQRLTRVVVTLRGNGSGLLYSSFSFNGCDFQTDEGNPAQFYHALHQPSSEE